MCHPRSDTCLRLWSASTGREGEWKRRSRSRRRRGTEGEGGWREGREEEEEEQEGGRKLLWELLSRLSGEIMTDLSARLYFTPHHREISKKINKGKKKKWCNNLVCSGVPAQTLIFSSQSFFFFLSLSSGEALWSGFLLPRLQQEDATWHDTLRSRHKNDALQRFMMVSPRHSLLNIKTWSHSDRFPSLGAFTSVSKVSWLQLQTTAVTYYPPPRQHTHTQKNLRIFGGGTTSIQPRLLHFKPLYST